ncbi:hypothetical protein H4W23_00915 [Streptomyces gardneri]|nr:hypothetical protein H4W23_00915 [Streptomyces gardneri]
MPWTPVLATLPPGRTIRVHVSNVSGDTDGFHDGIGADPVGQIRDERFGAFPGIRRGVSARGVGGGKPGLGEVGGDGECCPVR